jgi:hypothetical protein
MSVEISSSLGNEKISRSTRTTAGLKLLEAAKVFSKVSLAGKRRKPSERTGSRLRLMLEGNRGEAAVAGAARLGLL